MTLQAHDEVWNAAQRHRQAGRPHALVTVLRTQAPSSARPGDKAVVTADGGIEGWIGGGCAQPAVLRAVAAALADGQPRRVRIGPDAGDRTAAELIDDVLQFGMACESGGALELFVDPVLPAARLLVVGASPVAAALVQLAPRVGFAVTLAALGADAAAHPDAQQVLPHDDAASVRAAVAPGAWVVVATQGRRDLQGLALALALQPRQVAFVASARKAAVLKASLKAGGADPAAVDAIVAPAGYPIAADTPQEIALSVLAAVVAHRRGGAMASTPPSPEPVVAPLPAATVAHGCCGGGG